MSIGRFEQLYYTHCTHGTSLARGKSSHAKEQVLGYATRAASLPCDAAEALERDLQGLVRYHLPRDTPAEQRTQLAAASAPVRLMYYPNCAGRELIGQVCYRTFDSSPARRVGSFFAHLVLAPPGVRRGSALAALQLLKAPGWRKEDGPDIEHALPELHSFDDLLKTTSPSGIAARAIDDRVLHSFVAADGPSEIVDPCNIIPRYMRNARREDRQMLLAKSLHGFLELDLSRQSFLLVAPPELAALIFYGILRLVPEQVHGEISFATFVSELASLPATLVGTTYADPRSAAASTAEVHSAGFTVNIFRGLKDLAFRNPNARYPYLMVELLAAASDFSGVKDLLDRADSLDVKTSDGLERVAEAHRVTEKLLAATSESNGNAVGRVTLADDLERKYARLVVQKRFASGGVSADDLRCLAESPNICLLFELLVESSGGGSPAVTDKCLPLLSDTAVSQLATHLTLPLELRKQMLLNWASHSHRLPKDLLPAFYESPVDPAAQPAWAPGIWRAFIKEASVQDLWKLYQGETKCPAAIKNGSLTTLHRLLDVADTHRRAEGLCDAQFAATRVLCEALDRSNDDQVADAVREFGEKLTRNYSGTRLAKWCQGQLDKLSDAREVGYFGTRLDLLEKMLGDRLGRASLQQYPSAAIDGWQRFRETLASLAEPHRDKEKLEIIRQLVTTFLSCVPSTLLVCAQRELFSAIVNNARLPLESDDRELLWQLFVLKAIKGDFQKCRASPETDIGGRPPQAGLEVPVLRCDFPSSICPSLNLAFRVEAIVKNRPSMSKTWIFEHGRPLQPNLTELRRKRFLKAPLDHLKLSYELMADGWPDATVTSMEVDLRTNPDARCYNIRLIDGAGRDQDDPEFLHGLLIAPNNS